MGESTAPEGEKPAGVAPLLGPEAFRVQPPAGAFFPDTDTIMTYDIDEKGFIETCKTCGVRGAHEVRIEIKMENPSSPYADLSREPYRITTCRTCGSVREQRMNDA